MYLLDSVPFDGYDICIKNKLTVNVTIKISVPTETDNGLWHLKPQELKCDVVSYYYGYLHK